MTRGRSTSENHQDDRIRRVQIRQNLEFPNNWHHPRTLYLLLAFLLFLDCSDGTKICGLLRFRYSAKWENDVKFTLGVSLTFSIEYTKLTVEFFYEKDSINFQSTVRLKISIVWWIKHDSCIRFCRKRSGNTSLPRFVQFLNCTRSMRELLSKSREATMNLPFFFRLSLIATVGMVLNSSWWWSTATMIEIWLLLLLHAWTRTKCEFWVFCSMKRQHEVSYCILFFAYLGKQDLSWKFSFKERIDNMKIIRLRL